MSKNNSSNLKEQRGASVSKVNWQDILLAWYQHHLDSALLSLKKLLATPVQSLMTWLVIAVALALPTSLLLIVGNVNQLGAGWEGNPKLTVFLRQGASSSSIAKASDDLQGMSDILSVEYISPEQGLDEFKQYSGFGDALTLLKDNPLPPVYLVEPKQSESLNLKILAAQIEEISGVDAVQWDLEWVERLRYITALVERSSWLLGFFLSLGVLLTVGNTIRLAIENRRDEIVIIKLVGGTDAFVRRPLLYCGIWYGLVGGVIAWLLLAIAGLILAPVIGGLLSSYQSDFDIQGAGLFILFILTLIGGLLGLAGAWLAVARQLQSIQPR